MNPINSDGMVWVTQYPSVDKTIELNKKKYSASIPDERLEHCSFESFGWHHAWADTIDELIEDIKSFNVPYYSSSEFLNQLRAKDKAETADDRQIELHWDGRGTKITRGQLTYKNMTEYTSF